MAREAEPGSPSKSPLRTTSNSEITLTNAVAERIGRPRAGRLQVREPASTGRNRRTWLAVVAPSAGFGVVPVVQAARRGQRRTSEEADDRRPGAQAAGGAVEVRHVRRRHRGSGDEASLRRFHQKQSHNSSRPPHGSGGSGWTNRARAWPQKPIRRMVSSTRAPPAASGILVKPPRRRPYVRLIVPGDGPRHANGLGTRNPECKARS